MGRNNDDFNQGHGYGSNRWDEHDSKEPKLSPCGGCDGSFEPYQLRTHADVGGEKGVFANLCPKCSAKEDIRKRRGGFDSRPFSYDQHSPKEWTKPPTEKPDKKPLPKKPGEDLPQTKEEPYGKKGGYPHSINRETIKPKPNNPAPNPAPKPTEGPNAKGLNAKENNKKPGLAKRFKNIKKNKGRK